MAFEMINEGDGFFIRHTGGVTFDEIAEANDLLIAHDKWAAHRYQLWSFLDAGAIMGNAKDARVISKVDEMSLGRDRETPIQVAFVSTNSKTNEVITAYMDSVDKDRIRAQLFSTMEDARIWIRSA